MSGVAARTLHISAEQLEILAMTNNEGECEVCGEVNRVPPPDSTKSILRRIAKDLRKVADDGVEP